MTPLPWKVLATGMLNFSENRTRAAVASARAAPCPASTTGRLASRRMSTARATWRTAGASARTTLRGHVFRHSKVDRGRAFGLGELVRFADHLRYGMRGRDTGRPPGDRREHRHQVDV